MDSLAADMGFMMRDMLRNMHLPVVDLFLAVLHTSRIHETKRGRIPRITICHREWSLIRSHPNCSDAVNGG
jgi:hypothetical protein